ncbi:MAG: FecR family protein [Gallionella sp.]|nr:FecR family protein [Gallionella sp.]
MKIKFLVTAILLMIATVAQAAEVVGKIGYMSGALVAQRTDGTVKVLGPKAEVQAGDMLITAKDSYAQVLMNDGAKMTLRPNSNLRIEAFQFSNEAPQDDNAIFRLLKGGFRNVTGLIGKRGNADAFKVRAASATIGIRGTDFSSRLCVTQDCKDDEEATAKQAAKPQETQPQAVGRVMLVQGGMSAKKESGKVRKLTLGAPVYEGDTLMTDKNSYAVVAFRDESRVSLQESTVFHVEKFKYDKAAAQENAALKLLKGGVRVVTGWIGRTNHDNYQFKVSNATIGIRGTGFDAWCNGPCASGVGNLGATQDNPLDGAGVYVWAGEVVLVAPGGSFIVAIQQAAIIARDTGKPVQIIAIPPAITDNATPRPDGIPVDTEKLFGPGSDAGEPGLYVTVHDGEVIVAQADQSLNLVAGETGFASANVLVRLPAPPGFMGADSKVDLGPGNKNILGPNGCAIGQ